MDGRSQGAGHADASSNFYLLTRHRMAAIVDQFVHGTRTSDTSREFFEMDNPILVNRGDEFGAGVKTRGIADLAGTVAPEIKKAADPLRSAAF